MDKLKNIFNIGRKDMILDNKDNAWLEYSKSDREELNTICDGYMDFLDKGKILAKEIGQAGNGVEVFSPDEFRTKNTIGNLLCVTRFPQFLQ